MDRPLKLLFAGEGGQGIQTIAKLFTKAAFEQGLHTIYIPNFGVEQRGGVSLSFVQIWDQPVDAPKFQIADVLIVLSDRATKRVVDNFDSKTKIIYDPFTVKETVDLLKTKSKNLFEIQATEVSAAQLTPRSANVLIMGAVSDLTNVVKRELLVAEMHKKFGKYYDKKPELKELNERAFKLGERFIPGGETGE